MIGPFAFQPKATVRARAFPMAQTLAARGHEVSLLLAPYDNPAEGGRTYERRGVKVCALALGHVGAVTPLRAAWKLASLTRHARPDVVHVFKPVGYAALAGMILRLTSSLPLVTDTDDWEGTGGWNSVNPYPWHWKRFFDFQERWLPRHSAAVTVASRTLETQVWGMGVPPERVFYVPNCPGPDFVARCAATGVEDGAQVRARLGLGDAPLAVYTGHITLGDDLDLALVAWSQVVKHIPNARLLIVGTGEGLARLRALAAALELDDAVLFTGWVEHEAVPSLLRAADVAIYPYRDSLINRAKCSIKILEYMAMGKAIVTSRVGQNLEYIEHGKSGLLVTPGSADEFANGVIALLRDRALAERMGREAYRRINDLFTWERRIVDVERAYQVAGARPR